MLERFTVRVATSDGDGTDRRSRKRNTLSQRPSFRHATRVSGNIGYAPLKRRYPFRLLGLGGAQPPVWASFGAQFASTIRVCFEDIVPP